MELKLGYKQTDVGVIPEEWEAARLGDRTTKVGSGITPTGGSRVYKQEGRPFLRSQNVGWGNLLLDDIAFIDDDTHATFQDTEIEAEDVFLNITGASIGRSALADVRVQRGNVNQHVCIIRTNQAELHPRFLNYFLLSTAGQRQIDSFQAGGNRQGLNFGQVRSFRLPLPPLPEQRAIAEALSDVDTLIGTLDSALSKKRDLKQAAMQQLLTGKIRLPGFHGKWEMKSLGSVLIKGRLGGNYPNQDRESDYPLMKMGNIARGYIDTAKIEYITLGITPDQNHRLCYGDVLFNTRNTLDLVGKVAIWRNELPVAYYNSNLMRLEFLPQEVCSNEYANYALNSAGGVARLRALATGTTSVAAIYTRDLLGLPFMVPPPPEQTAIAEVLSDMDAELAALTQRRDKTRAL